jgi:hypothetical protein
VDASRGEYRTRYRFLETVRAAEGDARSHRSNACPGHWGLAPRWPPAGRRNTSSLGGLGQSTRALNGAHPTAPTVLTFCPIASPSGSGLGAHT